MTAIGTASAAVPAPAAVSPPGWKLIASDDFTSSDLGSQWGTYGGSYGIGANAWSGDEVSSGGGTLRVRMERKTTAGKPYTSGGAAMWGLTQTYGRYEFQAKCPTTPGIDSYITLWPKNDDDSNSMLIELLDKPAVSPRLQAAYLTINYGSGTAGKSVPGSYCGSYHSYAIEWTPAYESVTVDGTPLLKSPASSHASRWIGFITSNGDNLTGTPGPGDPLPAEFDVQHLRVYAYSPGAPGSTTSSASASATTARTSASTSATPSAKASASGASASGAAGTSGSPVSGGSAATLGGSAAAATTAAKTGSSGTSVALLATGAGAVVAAGGLLVALMRRRRPSGAQGSQGSHRR